MPVLDVELVCDGQQPLRTGLAQELADGVGSTLRAPPGSTWVRTRVLDRSLYAENGAPLAVDELPVFVKILQRQPPAGEALDAEVAAVTDAIAKVVGRPSDRVHVQYAASAIGRQAFGGKVVR